MKLSRTAIVAATTVTTLAALALPTVAAVIDGTLNDDILKGTPQRDRIDGAAGDDVIWAHGGNDSVNGGRGADRIALGRGNDEGDGARGHDTIFGGPGADSLVGMVIHPGLEDHSNVDIIYGGRGPDFLYGSMLYGGPGNDELQLFGPAGDHAFGGDGDDIISGDWDDGYRDVIRCGPGRDIVHADRNDQLFDCEVIR